MAARGMEREGGREGRTEGTWHHLTRTALPPPPPLSLSGPGGNRLGLQIQGVATLLCSKIKRSLKHVDICLLQGGCVRGRADYGAGPFTYGDLMQEMPFETEIATVTLPGWVIEESVWRSRASAPEEQPTFLHHDEDTAFEAVEGSRALVCKSINGAPFDRDRDYRVAIYHVLVVRSPSFPFLPLPFPFPSPSPSPSLLLLCSSSPPLPFPPLLFPSLPSPPLPFPSLYFPFPFPFPSLPIPSLPFPSLPFPSLPFPSLPFPSLPFPSLPFPSLPFLPFLLLKEAAAAVLALDHCSSVACCPPHLSLATMSPPPPAPPPSPPSAVDQGL